MAYTTIDDPTAFFQCTLYTGNNGTQTITHTGNSDLQADMIWGKARNDSAAHFRIDSVRGVSKRFKQNADAESTVSTGITAIGSDSFALGNDGDFNDNSINYATWNWKAGTSFTNDASSTGVGTIDSAGSFNNDAGFSIFTFTGTGSIGTIKHGLNTKPDVIFIKGRSEAKAWTVYHSSLGAGKALFLQATDAAVDHPRYWNDVEPTTSVFTGGSSTNLTGSGITFVGYAFTAKKGYSKFGSYVGNGNADGTFIYTGFKPAFVMTKSSATTSNWEIKDNKRLGYNTVDTYIKANAGSAEDTGVSSHAMDFLSNGFKHRGNNDEVNGSGEAYIYMAFAENPFTTSTGIPATAR